METNEELVILFQSGDSNALSRLITNNMRLCRTVARKWSSNRETINDLAQEGAVALWNAAKSYSPGKKRFSTYAYKGIERRIRQIVHKHSIIFIPPSHSKETTELKEYKNEMKSRLVYSLDYMVKNNYEVESNYFIPHQEIIMTTKTSSKKIEKGVIVVRMTPEQHKRAKFAATLFPEVSLNIFCREAILEHTEKRLLEIEEPNY